MLMGLLLVIIACRNTQESYVYGGKIIGRAVLAGVGEETEPDYNYAGVSVNLQNATSTQSALTVADGKFTFSDLPDGTYRVFCQKALYSMQTSTPNPVVDKSGVIDVGDILMTPISPPPPPIE